MLKAGTYSVTNSANATVIASTQACTFLGANIDKGPGTLQIYDGTTLVCSISSPTLTTPGAACPALPIAFRTGISMTCSGTGVCTLFWAISK